MPSGTATLSSHGTAALDPGRAGLVVVPGTSGRMDDSGDDGIPVMLGRTSPATRHTRTARDCYPPVAITLNTTFIHPALMDA
ncbi:hypothetical protein GCM10027445_43940 [Amycolatopsis endophytica]